MNIIKRGLGALQNLVTRGFGLSAKGSAGPGSPKYYEEYIKYSYSISWNLKGRKKRKTQVATLPLSGIKRATSNIDSLLKGKKQSNFKLDTLLTGTKRLSADKVFPIKGTKKHTSKTLPLDIKGIKLSNHQTKPINFKGIKESSIFNISTKLKGTRDITAVLEALDLLD